MATPTPNPPRIPVFYTLTKIHKPTPVGRPIISGCDSPTEQISSFVDYLLQPIAKVQKSYLKDKTDFLNFTEKTKVEKDTVLKKCPRMLLADILTSHRRKESLLYVKHVKFIL